MKLLFYPPLTAAGLGRLFEQITNLALLKINKKNINKIKFLFFFIILSCRSKSLLRLGRNAKKLYEVELIQSLRDQLK